MPRPLAILLLTTSLLSGCAALDGAQKLIGSFTGGTDNADPPAELKAYQMELSVDVLWREQIGDGLAGKLFKLQPELAGNTVFAASHDGELGAFLTDNGDSRWYLETDYAFASGPGYHDGRIFLGTSNAEVVAFDALTGAELWRTRLSSEIASVPVADDNQVLARTTDGRLFALDSKTGAMLWNYEQPVPALSLRGAGTPIIFADKLLCGFANGKMLAMRLRDGKLIWETAITLPAGRTEIDRMVDLVADPVLDNGIIYVAGYRGGLSALFESQGDILWNTPNLSSYTGLTLDNRYLYLTDNNSDVWQVDKRNGRPLWKQAELHQRGLTAPAIDDEYLVVGDFAGYVHWLALNDGRQVARQFAGDGPIVGRPLVRDAIVYVYTADGTLAAIKRGSL
ncbi:MAG: outer membrane protein assembly factor BamB [Methylococcales bacterium]|nr:outer membrane protein assembly factor BamB [Methylococcales bacterium]